MKAPDYSNYSLEELYDVLNTIDIDAFPERVEEVKRQIYIKQEVNGEEVFEPKIWWLRFKGFSIDSILATLPVALLDLVVSYPLPSAFFEILYLVCFVGYFGYFEILIKSPSIGKARYGLDIDLATRGFVDTKKRVIRLAVFATPFVIGTSFNLNIAIPFILEVLLYGLSTSIFLYNIITPVYFSSGQTIHDVLSHTVVCQNNEQEAQRIDAYSGHHWQVLTAFVFLISTSLFLLLEESSPLDSQVNQAVEKKLATELGVRANVSVIESQVWTLGQDNVTRNLGIKIWVPLSDWNDNTIQKVTKVALDKLTITPGYFDEGTITVETGWIFTLSETFNLSLP